MRRIIIDTDPGIDDALAILLALSAGDALEVAALTTVNGNTDVEQAARNAFRILEAAKRSDIPVYRGSAKPLIRERKHSEEYHGDDGLGNLGDWECAGVIQKEPALDFLVRKVREEKGAITLVMIGPLTNLAHALKLDSEFADNVKEVVIMGGSVHGGNMTPHGEFNFWTDPEAAKIVFQAGFKKVTMIGLDATSYIWLTPALRELLYQINTPVSRFIHRITRAYVDGHWQIGHRLGCELCDVLAVAYLLDSSVAETTEAFVAIETQGLCEGASVVYPVHLYQDKTCNCHVAMKADPKKFFEIFFHYLFPDYVEDVNKLQMREGDEAYE